MDKQKIAFRCPERGGDKKIYFKWNIEEEKIRGEKKLEKFGFYYKSLSLNIERCTLNNAGYKSGSFTQARIRLMELKTL